MVKKLLTKGRPKESVLYWKCTLKSADVQERAQDHSCVAKIRVVVVVPGGGSGGGGASEQQMSDLQRRFLRECYVSELCTGHQRCLQWIGYVDYPSCTILYRQQRLGTLERALHKGLAGFEWTLQWKYYFAVDIARALRYLHRNGVAHGDVHVGSVELSLRNQQDLSVVLTDFEWAQVLDGSFGGAQWPPVDRWNARYSSPEVHRNSVSSSSSLSSSLSSSPSASSPLPPPPPPKSPESVGSDRTPNTPLPDQLKASDMYSLGMLIMDLVCGKAQWTKRESSRRPVYVS